MIDPHSLHSDISHAYGAYIGAVRSSVQPQIMGWVSLEVLDGIETLAASDNTSRIAALHAGLLALLRDPNLATSDQLRDEFGKAYREAEALAFPSATAFIAHAQALTDWTQNHNLVTADLKRLRGIDLKAHTDSTYFDYAKQICAILPDLGKAPNVTRYGQFFEIYSEALVFEFLRDRLATRKIPEGATPTPDFQCELESGRSFFIEVKTFDIVGGALRHNEIMVDAIDQAVSLEEQVAKGKAVAIAEGEVAPYMRYRESDYDPRSLRRVIDTLRTKCWQSFKPAQFTLGPTFALAVTDRIIVPGGQCALAPYYFDPYDGGACVSGVLWQCAFGRIGTPILRLPDFAGAPNLEDYLSAPGIFVDKGQSFPGLGLIALSRNGQQDSALGLHPATRESIGGWDGDATAEPIAAICDARNDDLNSQAFRLSCYASSPGIDVGR